MLIFSLSKLINSSISILSILSITKSIMPLPSKCLKCIHIILWTKTELISTTTLWFYFLTLLKISKQFNLNIHSSYLPSTLHLHAKSSCIVSCFPQKSLY